MTTLVSYLVRCSFTNRFGSEFSWVFQVATNDYRVAFDEAVPCFWSGLTRSEREDACETIHVIAWTGETTCPDTWTRSDAQFLASMGIAPEES
jgi:hypothetical protein